MSKEKGIKIRFDIDDSPVKSALSQIEKEARKLQKSLKDIDKLLEMDPTNINLLTQKQSLLSKSIENTTSKLKAMEEAQDRITSANEQWHKVQKQLENNSSEIRKMMDNLEQAQEQMNNLQTSNLDENSEEYKRVSEEVKNYEQALKKLREEQKALKNAQKNNIDDTTYQNYLIDVESLRINLNQLRTDEQNLSQTMSQLARSTDDVSNNTSEESEASKRAAEASEEQARAEQEKSEQLKKVSEQEKLAAEAADKYQNSLKELKDASNKVKEDFVDITNVIKKGTEVIAGAAVAGGTAAAKIGMDFTSSMSKVESYSQASASDMEKLSAIAREAGANTSKSASEAADALGYMSLAGYNTKEMMTGLMPILRASEAGQMDLATCSDLVTDSMSALGLSVNDLSRYLDIVASSQSNSNTSMEQLLGAYIQCGGTLDNLNVSLEESASLLGVLANRGKKGEEAGRSLNSIIVNLVGANSRAASALDELGVSAWDNEGKFIGLTNTIKLLDDALSKSTDKQRAMFEAAVGGKTQMDTLQALIKGVRGEYDSLNKTLTNSQGALEKTAAAMQDNLSGDITKLQSILEETGNEIFENFEEPFRLACQQSISSIDKLNNTLDGEEFSSKIKKISESISDLYTSSVELATDDVIPTIINWLNWISDNSDVVIAGLYGVGTAWATWKLGQLVIHLNEMKNKMIETVVAQKALTVAQAENAASTTASTLTIKDYTAALAANKVAMLGIYAAAIALTAVIAKLIAQKIDEAGAALLAKNALDEETEAVYRQSQEIQKVSKERENEFSTLDKNSEKAKELWNRITELADAEGNAVGDVRDLQNAISEFNSVSGQNVEIVDGQIQGYKDLKIAMEDIINLNRKKAKLDYMQDDYSNAVFNVDEARENVAKAEQEYEELRKKSQEARQNAENEYQKALNSSGNGFIKIIDFTSYNEAKALSEKALDAEAQAAVRVGSLKTILSEYENTIEKYENILNDTEKQTSMTQEEAKRYAAEQEAQRLSKIEQDKVEKILEERQKKQEKLEQKLNELDEKLTKRKISDSEYWKEKEKYIEKYRDEENVEWWKYFSELEDHNNKEIKEQIETLKEKQENNDDYTVEMMNSEIEEIISGLDKESEIYKKYNQEIINSRKELSKESTEKIKEGLKEDVSEIEKSIKEVQSKYKSEMDSLLSEKESYYKKLQSLTNLTGQTTQTDGNGNSADIFSLTDPAEALRKLDEWEKRTNEIKAKGASEAVMSWIDGLDTKTAEKTIEVLSNMSDDRLKEYSDSFEKYQNKIQQMTDNKYQDKINELNTKFVQEIDSLLSQLPASASVAGYDTAEGFVQGFSSDTNNLYDTVSSFTDEFLNTIKENLDINSPSKKTEELGEYASQGFAAGMSEEKASQIAASFVDSFIETLKEKDPEIKKALQDSFSTDVDLSISSVKTSIDSMKTLASQVPTIPSINSVSTVETASQTKNNTENTELLSNIKNLISLIQEGQTQKEQTIKLSIDISGQLSADVDELTTVISKKVNDIVVQTGKGVFIQ